MRVAPLLAVLLASASPLVGEPGDLATESPGKARLQAAIANAVAGNPEISQMEGQVEAARLRIPQTRALEDPEVELGIKDFPVADPSLSRDDFTMEMFGVRQRFPAAGKRDAEKAVAEAELDAARTEHRKHVIEIAADVADVFFSLGEIDRKIDLAEQTRRRLDDAVTVTRERYRVGKGVQADVLRASLDKTALDDRLASLRAARHSEVARWNALQNQPFDVQVPAVPFEPLVDEPWLRAALPSLEELVRRSEQAGPAVAAAAAEVRRSEKRLGLAKLERRPGWSLYGYYARRESFEDLAGFLVSFNVPWVHPKRLDAKRAEREAELASAQAGLSVARNGLRRDIAQAYSELVRNREQSRLFRESILPSAEINYRAAREAYEVGSVDLLTYLRAATDLDMYASEQIAREAGMGRALAMLQKASGLPLIEGTPAPGGSHVEK
jgi:outer membrane protein TolC